LEKTGKDLPISVKGFPNPNFFPKKQKIMGAKCCFRNTIYEIFMDA